MSEHGLKASLTFDMFEPTEAEVEKILGPSERHGKNPGKYRLWTKALGQWNPGDTPEFESVADQAAQLAGRAFAAGIDGRRFITFSIRGVSAAGELQIPADFISVAAAVGLEIRVSLWNDDPSDEDEGKCWKLTVSARGEEMFSTDDIMVELPIGVFSALHEGDEAIIDVEHEGLHADVRIAGQNVLEAGRAKAGLLVRFRHI